MKKKPYPEMIDEENPECRGRQRKYTAANFVIPCGSAASTERSNHLLRVG